MYFVLCVNGFGTLSDSLINNYSHAIGALGLL